MQEFILRKNKIMGTHSQKIYLELCDKFGWNRNLANHFGNVTPFYNFAENATKEGYAVWFLPYSNLTNKSKNWTNFVSLNEITISQIGEKHKKQSQSIRVTFIKDQRFGYVFWGLFKLEPSQSNSNFDVLKIINGGEIYPSKH